MLEETRSPVVTHLCFQAQAFSRFNPLCNLELARQQGLQYQEMNESSQTFSRELESGEIEHISLAEGTGFRICVLNPAAKVELDIGRPRLCEFRKQREQ